MTDQTARADNPQRYGWVIVGAAFTIMGLTGGLTFYAMSAYINALVEDRGFSLQAASAGPTVSAAFGGLGGLFTARLMKTMAVRRIMMIGIVGLAVAMAGIGASHTIWQLWFAFALSGWFGAMASGIPVSSLVARWFPAAPAKPLVFAMTGMSFGGALIPPVVVGGIEAWGLTKGSLVLAVGMLVVVGTAVMFVKEPPASLMADAKPAQAANSSIFSKVFLALFFGMLCLFLSQISTTMHMIRLGTENGIGHPAMAVSVMAFGTFVGRVGGIPLLPAIGLRNLAVLVGITQGAAQFTLSAAHTESTLFTGTFLLGLAMGNVAILSSLFCIEAFGLDEYPRMMARMSLAGPIGSGIGPLLVAVTHGLYDGYQVPMIIMGVFSLMGGFLLLSTGIDSESSLRERRDAKVPAKIAEEIAAASADEVVVGTPKELMAQAEREMAESGRAPAR